MAWYSSGSLRLSESLIKTQKWNNAILFSAKMKDFRFVWTFYCAWMIILPLVFFFELFVYKFKNIKLSGVNHIHMRSVAVSRLRNID